MPSQRLSERSPSFNNEATDPRDHLRKRFEEECLSGTWNIQRYRSGCEYLHKKYPWFTPRPVSEWLQDTDEIGSAEPEQNGKDFVANLTELAARNRTDLEAIARRVQHTGEMVLVLMSGAIGWLTYTLVQRSYGVSETVAPLVGIAVAVAVGFYLSRLERR